jgi:hypothetical protein
MFWKPSMAQTKLLRQASNRDNRLTIHRIEIKDGGHRRLNHEPHLLRVCIQPAGQFREIPGQLFRRGVLLPNPDMHWQSHG